jgi:peroxiredoxin
MSDVLELGVGAVAPDFRLPSNKEGNIGLGDYLGKSNLYLFFIREYN